MGVPRAHARPRIYSENLGGGLRRRLHDQLEVECVPRNTGTHLRPALRARLPSGEARGAAGRDLSTEARRRRSQARHFRAAAAGAGATKRQARRLRRGRPGFADGRARSRHDRLRGRRLRFRFARRRNDAQPNSRSFVCPTRSSTRRSATPCRPAVNSSPAGASTVSRACWAKATTRFSSAAARRAAATSTFPDAAKQAGTSTSASIGWRAFRSVISLRSAGAWSCWAAAIPPWIAAGPRDASAAPTSKLSCAPDSPR